MGKKLLFRAVCAALILLFLLYAAPRVFAYEGIILSFPYLSR